MSNNIDLKKGLDLPVKGSAQNVVSKRVVSDISAIVPDDFKGINPRLLVKEGDKVLAGSPILSDKKNPEIIVTAPVSGTVEQIVRGDKRKLLAVLIKRDAIQEFVDFGAKNASQLTSEEVKNLLLSSGLWVSLIQRPYGTVADPAASPKAIFVSAFSTAPLAPDYEFTCAGQFDAIQAAITALSKIAPVNVSIKAGTPEGSGFRKIKDAAIYSFKGKHPAGNVGIQIANISPIAKDQIVWTISPMFLAAFGKLLKTGKLNLTRKVAITGPAAIETSYIEAEPGMPVSELAPYYGNTPENIRVICGDMLSGKKSEGYLGFFTDQITIVSEGAEYELFGWAKPIRSSLYSSTRSYFSWLMPWKKYNMDTNLHGGPRAFVMSDSYYSRVLPMDIYPLYLIKACIAGDIDKMEKYGIYEVLPEDLALCEYIDPSKNYIQDIIQNGIDLMLKEMA